MPGRGKEGKKMPHRISSDGRCAVGEGAGTWSPLPELNHILHCSVLLGRKLFFSISLKEDIPLSAYQPPVIKLEAAYGER